MYIYCLLGRYIIPTTLYKNHNHPLKLWPFYPLFGGHDWHSLWFRVTWIHHPKRGHLTNCKVDSMNYRPDEILYNQPYWRIANQHISGWSFGKIRRFLDPTSGQKSGWLRTSWEIDCKQKKHLEVWNNYPNSWKMMENGEKKTWKVTISIGDTLPLPFFTKNPWNYGRFLVFYSFRYFRVVTGIFLIPQI